MVGEAWLEAYLQQATARRRAPLPAQQRAELEQRDAADRRDLQARGGGQLHAEDLALPGRTTGDAAWLAQRGEDGSAGVGRRLQGAAAAAVPPPGTRYRLARDEGLRAEQPQRVCGGAVRASGENTPSETAACALDGNQGTKWLDFGGPKGNAWLEYRLPADQPAAALHSYALTSANDSPERDPCHVVLEAWPDGAWGVVWGGEGMHACRGRQAHAFASCGLYLPPLGPLSLTGPAPLLSRLRVQEPLTGWCWMSGGTCASLPATTACCCTLEAGRRRPCRPPAASGCGWCE